MAGWLVQRNIPGSPVPGHAPRALLAGTLLVLAFQAGCHKSSSADQNSSQPPIVSYATTTLRPTVGEPFASVPADAVTYVTVAGIRKTSTTGFTFSINPALPAGLSLDTGTGVISGTPVAAGAAATYVVTAVNGSGYNTCALSVGVQASSPVSMTYGGLGAVSGVVDGALVLPPPTVAGGVPAGSGFGVSPALPSGLTLNQETGALTGTPVAAQEATPYTVTLSTPQGTANAGFTLVVAAAAPTAPLGLTYAGAPYAATVNQPFSVARPTCAGTSLVYTVAPALPAGLVLDPLTGAITGTPTAAAAQATYTVTASNASGTSTADLLITVAAS